MIHAPHGRDALTRAKGAKPRQEYGAQTRIAKDVSALCIMSKCLDWHHEYRKNTPERGVVCSGDGVDIGFGGYGVGG